MQKTVVTIILTALIAGGGVYFWQQQKTGEPTNTVTQTQQPESLAQPTVVASQKASPQYSSMDTYVDLVVNPSTNNQYKTSKPSEFQRAKFGDTGGEINVAPDGASTSVYVLAKKNWDTGNMEDVQTFYLEVSGPSPCWSKPDCTEPNTVDFYGPFEGKLQRLVQ
ncbi:hypothetical protein KBD59_02985 [Candidatus Gracilibacteria bacterium]|nr:hypothetical protein [Candidatus Gracilibacteria bacterium]